MYAIIENGGKQYKIREDDSIKIEKSDLDIGDKIEFNTVLMGEKPTGEIEVGTPSLKGAKAVGEVISQGRGDKITTIKFRRRKHSMKKQGHRQYYTEVKILSINL